VEQFKAACGVMGKKKKMCFLAATKKPTCEQGAATACEYCTNSVELTGLCFYCLTNMYICLIFF